MGHRVGKDVYRQLGQRIDTMPIRAPWNDTMREMLAELYSPEEAELVVRMPYGLSTIDRLERVTGVERGRLEHLLEGLCSKGLVVDLQISGAYRYSVSPLVIGIFEFTMMRTDDRLDRRRMAGIFHDYLSADTLFAANFGHGEEVALMRSLPHDGTVAEAQHLEILDYERAVSIVEGAERFAMGLCSCRHEKHHVGLKECETPMDNCSSFGAAAEYLVRRDLAREVSRSEMLDNLARSRELGLVLNADNVQRRVTFICHCCSCCCNALAGVRDFGYPNSIVTSSYMAASDTSVCLGCNQCQKACPINAITRVKDEDPTTSRSKRPVIDEELCLGCGVCATRCPSGAMRLERRGQRVIPPETTFHRVLLTALEHGTLQHQLFDNPAAGSHRFLRAVIGGFLKLTPVKRGLMSDALRSRFLAFMEGAVRRRGEGWLQSL